MAIISTVPTVSLMEAAVLIATNPRIRFRLEGEPGVGKSSILKVLAKMLPGYNIVYRDVQTMDLGDTAMPAPDHEAKVTRYYPNAGFKLHLGKPVCIMLDEFSKGMQPVQNMLHPMLEVANPRLGDVELVDGSIVFLTGNLATDGVGDNVKAHTRNRVSTIRVRKPTDSEWLAWGIDNDIEPSVLGFVRQTPHCLASYTDDGQKENPYIYNPKQVQLAFVSPRSLELASTLLKSRHENTHDALMAALIGTMGEAGARDLMAFVAYQDQLPTWEEIIKDPKHAKVPESPGACAVLVFGAIAKIDKATMTPFMQYIERFESEWQATFAVQVAKNQSKCNIAFSCKEFADWIQRNEDLL